MINKVLFVCTGNTCRSPMAEAILKSKGLNIEVASAGVHATEGGCASEYASRLCKDTGKVEHFAKPLTQSDIHWADIVLTMTSSHKKDVLKKYGFHPHIHTLSEFISRKGECLEEVMDPYGGTLEDYKTTFDLLENYIERFISKL